MKEKLLIVVLIFLSSLRLSAQEMVIREKAESGFFPIVTVSGSTTIYVDEKDHWLMHKAAELLQQDLEMLTGQKVSHRFHFTCLRR